VPNRPLLNGDLPGASKWRSPGRGWRFDCVVPGCSIATTRLTAPELFCDRHWQMVPSDVKRVLLHRYRPLKLQTNTWTERFARAIDQAVADVLQVQLSGHRIYRATESQWDD